MSYKWNDNDKKIWNASEVLKELEVRLARAKIELEKKAQTGVAEKTEKAKNSVNELNKSLVEAIETGKGLADDHVQELSDQEKDALARESLLGELRDMAIQASNCGNTKLAYKIERTIEDLALGE